MSFSVIVGRTNKGENSTFQFDLSTGITVDCVLRKGCSILKPVLELNVSWSYATSALLNCNVAFIADFNNRYYRIINWQFDGPLIAVYLEVDVMATYKSQLSTQSFYIIRSVLSSLCNPAIVDTSLPQPCGMSHLVVDLKENPLQPPADDYGVFLIGVINNTPTFGAVEYYVMTYLVFRSLMNALCNMSNMGDFTDVSDGVAKAIANPFQYIVSCKWFPYTIPDFTNRGLTGGGVSSIRMGYYNVSFTGTAYYYAAGLLNIEFTNVTTLTINKNPLNDGKHDYLNYAPYSRYIFNFYPFGSFEIDPALLYGFNTLYVWYSVDLRTGYAVCKIGPSVAGSDYTNWRMPQAFKTLTANIAVDVPLASIQSYLPSASDGILASATNAVSSFGGFGQLFKKASASMATGIGKLIGLDDDTMSAVYENIGADPFTKEDLSKVASAAVQSNSYAELHGMQGTVSQFHTNQLTLIGIFYGPRSFAGNAVFGYPVCNTMALSNLSGYSLCANARPRLDKATETELAEVEKILNSGFVWE